MNILWGLGIVLLMTILYMSSCLLGLLTIFSLYRAFGDKEWVLLLLSLCYLTWCMGNSYLFIFLGGRAVLGY